MCEFCGRKECTLTKKQVLERGPILEVNASDVMRGETEDTPQTYVFDGVPAFYSLSALIPDEGEEDPHAYTRWVFDEDTGCDGEWEYRDIYNPLDFQTEKEFLEKLERKKIQSNPPQERVKQSVYATGNRWAIENYNATHN